MAQPTTNPPEDARGSGGHDQRVELEVPGAEAFLEVLRATVGRIARMNGFSYDGIEDFCLAVDEAGALLLESRPARLHLTIRRGTDGLTANVAARDPAVSWPPAGLEDDMRWQVIRVLCESHSLGSGASIDLAQSIR